MKNTLNGFLIIMCLVGVHLFAQQVSNNNLKQYAKHKYPERFLPKDEFETMAKYNQRLKHQVEIIDERREELLSELKAKKQKRNVWKRSRNEGYIMRLGSKLN